jgi:type III pantothenate kinase
VIVLEPRSDTILIIIYGQFPDDRVTEQIKIALAIGNSRYHWAWFLNTELQSSWDTAYWTSDIIAQLGSTNLDDADFLGSLPIDLQQILVTHQLNISALTIWLVSVVPIQTKIWQQLPQVEQITLADLPLLNLYPTFGIDRALAILGAGEHYGYPALVIDGGTALTITGVDNHRNLVGGAIMPGLRLQFYSLFTDTAALPKIELPGELPARWSNNTSDAIASGILHTVCSGIRDFIYDWEVLYPNSKILITGGDGEILIRYLRSTLAEDLADQIYLDRQLLFRGIAAIIQSSG